MFSKETLKIPLIINIPVIMHCYRGVTLNIFSHTSTFISADKGSASNAVSLNVGVVIVTSVFLKQDAASQSFFHDVQVIIIP